MNNTNNTNNMMNTNEKHIGRPVTNVVTKWWARQVMRLLAKNYDNTTTLFIELRTVTHQECQVLKSEAAQLRVANALSVVAECVRYGWACAINGHQARFTRPRVPRSQRRLSPLIAPAIQAGFAIGLRQTAKAARPRAATGPTVTP